MAYLAKHPKSRFWFAIWRDAGGKQIRRSTKATNRKIAMRIAGEYELATLKRRTSRQVREVIASLHREITGDELAFPTVKEYVAAWLERKGPETADSTLAFYKKSTGNFLSYLGEAAEKPIDQITNRHVSGFRNSRAKAVARRTANHDLKAIRMLFKAARKEGFVFENPAEDVATLRGARGETKARRPFTMQELRAVMDVASKEWRSMIQFGLFTGMRLSDVASLTWANLDMARNELRYEVRKTGKVIILPIVGPLADHIATLDAPDDPNAALHPNAYDSLQRTGKTGTLSNWFADLLADAGLRERKKHHRKKDEARKGRSAAREQSRLSFHCLRHTAVTMLKEAGVPAAVVMALVGHDSEQMSNHYTSVGLDALATAAKQMPSIAAP